MSWLLPLRSNTAINSLPWDQKRFWPLLHLIETLPRILKILPNTCLHTSDAFLNQFRTLPVNSELCRYMSDSGIRRKLSIHVGFKVSVNPDAVSSSATFWRRAWTGGFERAITESHTCILVHKRPPKQAWSTNPLIIEFKGLKTSISLKRVGPW